MLEFKNKPDLSTPITADNLNANFNELNLKIQSGSNWILQYGLTEYLKSWSLFYHFFGSRS